MLFLKNMCRQANLNLYRHFFGSSNIERPKELQIGFGQVVTDRTIILREGFKSNFIFIFFSVLFIFLAVVGGLLRYSPVPFWDMWDGYLGFYVKAFDGDWSSWFAQHNEHRIFLSRILFWIDIAIFSGSSKFLIVVNYLLWFLLLFVFFRLLAKNCTSESKFLAYFVLCWLSYWIQHNNLEWGFQSQFLMAQIIPLCTFLFAFKSVQISSKKADFYFVGSLAGGCLSAGTMANGILVLPLLFLYALVLRFEKIKIFTILLATTLVFFLYFFNYASVSGHGSLQSAFFNSPFSLLQYVFLYIGGPFYYLFGKGFVGVCIGFFLGFFLVCSAFFSLISALKSPQNNSFQLFLLLFLLYIGGTAIGTAAGRLAFGLEQATSSRYMTPALMAWAVLLLLYLPSINRLAQQKALLVRSLFIIVLILMLPYQLKALFSKTNSLFEREIGALALELQIFDQEQISHIFPSAEWALSIAVEPSKRNLSIFGLPPIKDARERIGQQEYICNNTVPNQSVGFLDKAVQISGDQGWVRLEGWAFSASTHSSPEVLHILNNKGVVVGLALTGQSRPDVAANVDLAAMYSGFKGYVIPRLGDDIFWIQDAASGYCLKVMMPKSLVNFSQINPKIESISASINQVLSNHRWLGADYYRSQIADMKIFGTFVNSDRDTGSISLNLRKGESLLYRSGPTVGRQILEIIGCDFDPYVLPLAVDWVKIQFVGNDLPEKFEARFSDNGNAWGEWSAIAVNLNSKSISSLKIHD